MFRSQLLSCPLSVGLLVKVGSLDRVLKDRRARGGGDGDEVMRMRVSRGSRGGGGEEQVSVVFVCVCGGRDSYNDAALTPLPRTLLFRK